MWSTSTKLSANKAADADDALQALGSDHVAFGQLTITVMVWHQDRAGAAEKERAVERAINGRGFATIRENINAVEAWLSSLPGHAYANVRQPLVHSLNLTHLVPLSAVWEGPARNAHLDGPPLLVAETSGSTPFRLERVQARQPGGHSTICPQGLACRKLGPVIERRLCRVFKTVYRRRQAASEAPV